MSRTNNESYIQHMFLLGLLILLNRIVYLLLVWVLFTYYYRVNLLIIVTIIIIVIIIIIAPEAQHELHKLRELSNNHITYSYYC